MAKISYSKGMITAVLIAFCLGTFALGYYCITYVVEELRMCGPTVVAMCTAGVAYATEGRAHPAVMAALRPAQEFARSRLEFMFTPGMAAMFVIIFTGACYELSNGHELFSLSMPILAVVVIVGFAVLLAGFSWVIKSIDAARLMPRISLIVPPERRPALLHFSIPAPFKPPRFLQVA